jgi:hypothetical protein
MGVDIDYYEYKETLKRYDEKDDEWLKSPEAKDVRYVTVGGKKVPKKVNETLKAHGYKKGDVALVIIQ